MKITPIMYFTIAILLLSSCRSENIFRQNNSSSNVVKGDTKNNSLIVPSNIIIATHNMTKRPYILEPIEGDNEYFLFSDDILINKRDISIVRNFNSPFNYNEISAQYNEILKSYNMSKSRKILNASRFVGRPYLADRGPVEPETSLWENKKVYFLLVRILKEAKEIL